jgi:hypothetical protein
VSDKDIILCVRAADIEARVAVNHDAVVRWTTRKSTADMFVRTRQINACWAGVRRNSFDGRFMPLRYFVLSEWADFCQYRKARGIPVELSSPLPVVSCELDAASHFNGEVDGEFPQKPALVWWKRFWQSIGGAV